MSNRFGKKDLIFFAILLVAAIGLLIFYQNRSLEQGQCIIIARNGENYGTYSLEKDQSISVKNEDGNVTNVVVIEDGVVHMEKATCPDHLCMHQKSISMDKETIVCLPNKVTITVIGGNEGELDAVAN